LVESWIYQEKRMELRHILSLIGKWAWLIALSVVIAAGSSYFGLFTSQQLAFTYSQLARREPVLKGAIESLGLDMPWQALANQVSTNIVAQTQLLEISVIDSNPYRAKALADAIAQQLILQSPAGSPLSNSDEIAFIQEQINELKGKIEAGQEELKRLRQELDTSNSALQIQDLQNQIDLLENKISGWQNTYSQLLLSLQGGDVNVLNVVEEATVPTHPISPNTPMNVLVAAAIGGALALGGILLMEYLDDSIKTPEDIERATGLPTIGTIVKIEGKTYADKLIAKGDPFNPLLEDFRALRNNIQYSTSKKPFRSLLVTSTAPGEGKDRKSVV
jgi:capsular polysaccharide biosynthesis protein